MDKKQVTAVTVRNPMKADLAQVTEMSLTKEDVIDLMVEQMKQEATTQYAELKKRADGMEKRWKEIALDIASNDKKIASVIALFPECQSPLVVKKENNRSQVSIDFDYDNGWEEGVNTRDLKGIYIDVRMEATNNSGYGSTLAFHIKVEKDNKYYAELVESFGVRNQIQSLGSKIQNFERNEKSVRRELKQKMLKDILNGTSEGKNLMEFIKTKVQSEFGKVIAGVQN